MNKELSLGERCFHSVRSSAELSRWHQDITPTNVLVRTQPGLSVYDCEFVIADLGLSHFKIPTSDKTMDTDSYGTRAYGMIAMDFDVIEVS